MSRVLRLLECGLENETLRVTCGLDGLQFHFSVRYEDVDLVALAREHGEIVDRLVFHVAMFHINAVASLRPDEIALGEWARFATPRFIDLWQTVFRHVWAQWRYEHDLRDYIGPAFVDAPAPSSRPHALHPGRTGLLAFCGGGKDSLVALRLLERGKLPFATLGYSHSVYGPPETQHALIERVASVVGRVRAERQWVADDFMGFPVAERCPDLGIRYVLAAETPASVFAALPLALARGYTGLVVAHEAGASTPNLVWRGEEVNHQWGKGWEAERLLDRYVGEELLAGVRYFSVLQPVHDEVIFALLARDAQLAQLTHSCNVRKPWCGRCPKCVYVWLQMAAHLPREVVEATFREDLGEIPENDGILRELLGLTGHTPFECVGSVPEARLALARLPRPLGPRMAKLAKEVGPVDVGSLLSSLAGVEARHGMPPEVARVVLPQLEDASRAAKR